MNAKHVYTAANVMSAIYRMAYTGVLLYHLFSKRRERDGSNGLRR